VIPDHINFIMDDCSPGGQNKINKTNTGLILRAWVHENPSGRRNSTGFSCFY